MSTDTITGKIPELTLAQRLRIARENAGMEQAEIADVLEISRGSVSAYERGVTKPKGLVLRGWAQATDTNESWLRTGEPGPDDPGPGLRLVAGTGFEPVTSGSRVVPRQSYRLAS